MFTNVLVGVDEEQLGRDAIALATQLVEDGGELTLAHIYHGDARIWGGAARSRGTVDRARRMLDEANQDAGGNAHLRWREAPSVGRGLHELAEAIHADLLVLGSCRHGALGRVLVGDDTRAALNGAPCGVAVAPAGYADSPARLRRIGVGYDGSPESQHALAVARTLAAEHFAQLVGFEAISAPDSALSGAVPDVEVLDAVVGAARDRVAALPGVEPHAEYSSPQEGLAEFSVSVDLLVVGSRGYGRFGRLVHGSTSQSLARSAACPLLVMPRAVRTAVQTGVHRDRGRASVDVDA